MNKIVKRAEFEGEGAHTGKWARIKVYDYMDWVIFEKDGQIFPLDINKVQTKWATIFAHNGFSVFTIEHLMAAFYGLSLRGARIVVEEGMEIPLLDGSSKDFVEILSSTLERLDGEEKHWVIDSPIEIKDGDRYIKAVPSDKFEIDYTIVFNHPLIGKQRFYFEFSEENFIRELAGARTFVHINDVYRLRQNGLAMKDSSTGVIVLTDTGLYNGTKLRYRDEFVRHKVLDLIGDLSFLRYKPLVKIEAYKAGHKLHIALTKEILAKGKLL